MCESNQFVEMFKKPFKSTGSMITGIHLYLRHYRINCHITESLSRPQIYNSVWLHLSENNHYDSYLPQIKFIMILFYLSTSIPNLLRLFITALHYLPHFAIQESKINWVLVSTDYMKNNRCLRNNIFFFVQGSDLSVLFNSSSDSAPIVSLWSIWRSGDNLWNL